MTVSGLSPEVRALWAKTQLFVWPERYWLASLLDAVEVAGEWVGGAQDTFVALVVERDEVSVPLPESLWFGSRLRARARSAAGPFAVLTFDLNLELDVAGYLAPLATCLAVAGVAIVPQCAFSKDHLLVHVDQLEVAQTTIQEFIAAARAEEPS
jgi:hypothetical protein